MTGVLIGVGLGIIVALGAVALTLNRIADALKGVETTLFRKL